MPEAQATRRISAARRRHQREESLRNDPPSYADSSAIHDRIRQWQAQDVSAAVDPDVLSVRSVPRSERARTPLRSKSPSYIPHEPQSTPRKRSTRWIQQDNAWVRQRRSTRDTRRSPDTTQNPRAEIEFIKGVQNEAPPPEYTRNESLRTRNVNSSRAERDLRRKRRREARARADNGHALTQDGIRVYAKSESYPASERLDQETAPAQSELSLDQRSLHHDTCMSEAQDARSTRRASSPYVDEVQTDNDHAGDSETLVFRQPSRYAQTLGRPPAQVEAIEQPKTRKRAILSKTKEILIGKNEPQPPISNRIPSIQAWLEEQPDMPDPFVDDEEVPGQQSMNAPSTPPRKGSPRRPQLAEHPVAEVADPNKIWESVLPSAEPQPKPRRSSRRESRNVSQQAGETNSPKRRLFSFEVCDELNKGEECPPQPPLHRDHEPQSPVAPKGRDVRAVKHAREIHSISISPAKSSTKASSAEREPQKNDTARPKATGRQRPLPQIPLETLEEVSVVPDKDAVELDRAPSRGLKRKLTTHEDLLSVLSQPRARPSTRSRRGTRRAQSTTTGDEILEAFVTMRREESQYARELRTLVDGVTPVLLQSLLSKNDSSTGLFSDGHSNDASLTRPIVEMGGALQRLKSLHGRMPLQQYDQEALLAWAGTAQKAYSDYVKAWKLGFHGIIVNLEPLDGKQVTDEEMLSRDTEGDVTNAQGEKVDVAFLQKRPLVRIKKLSKFFATIRDASPGHAKACSVAESFMNLTECAKQRHSEEQGRLEDEAAANTDVTRARDMKTMGVAESVGIDRRRKVRARDCFDMSLQHSTGQRLDCKIEIILRDDPNPAGTEGDILICQVEEASKWLLFAPVTLSHVSARKDQSSLDLVLMIRGVAGIGREWHELLVLRAEEQDAVTEWLHMLGSNPLPPRLNYSPSWQQTPEQLDILQDSHSDHRAAAPTPIAAPTPLSRAALASIQSDVDIPIGEPSVILARRKKRDSTVNAKSENSITDRTPQKLNLGGGLHKSDVSEYYQRPVIRARKQEHVSTRSPKKPSPLTANMTNMEANTPSYNFTDPHNARRHDIRTESGTRISNQPLVSRPKYSPQKFAYEPSHVPKATSASQTSYFTEREPGSHTEVATPEETRQLMREITSAEQSWAGEPLMSGGLGPASPDEIPKDDMTLQDRYDDTSSRPSPQVFINRPPRQTRSKSSTTTPLSETIREGWAAISGFRKQHQSTPNTPEKTAIAQDVFTADTPPLYTQSEPRQDLPHVTRPPSRQEPSPELATVSRFRPAAPRHQKSTYTISSSPQSSVVSLPLTPKETAYHPERESPLKHQYEPSSSASGTESDEDETDATSDVSEDVGSEVKDKATSLVNVGYGKRRSGNITIGQRTSIPSAGTRTLDPSDSASNGPYRQALPSSAYTADKKRRTIAMVCSWSDKGIWEPIRDDECSIVISPGLVQAFAMTAAHSQPLPGAELEESSQPSRFSQRPLVEFELTPVVPLRKGTALDITIRSPPTANSTVTTTNNVMFRSRTVQECEKLYQYINWARCHNPIFAQLARDRPRQEEAVTFAAHVQQSKGRSWFSFGSREKTSYRAASRPPASMADTAATGSSAASAFSALKRFGKNSPFSLKRSSVVRRSDAVTSGSSLYSSSYGTGASSGSSTPAPSQAGFVPGADGPNVPATSAEAANGGGMVNNMKIRLFVRQGQKWDALGQSLLTVLPAAVPPFHSTQSSTPTDGAVPPQRISRAPTSMPQPRTGHVRLMSSDHTPHRIHGDGREKRILITSAKRKELVLLDELLGESCFEKVMQTGIAIKVWKEDSEVRIEGGVMTGRSKMYMIQFRTSTEASWVFNMCGTYRYGGVTST